MPWTGGILLYLLSHGGSLAWGREYEDCLVNAVATVWRRKKLRGMFSTVGRITPEYRKKNLAYQVLLHHGTWGKRRGRTTTMMARMRVVLQTEGCGAVARLTVCCLGVHDFGPTGEASHDRSSHESHPPAATVTSHRGLLQPELRGWLTPQLVHRGPIQGRTSMFTLPVSSSPSSQVVDRLFHQQVPLLQAAAVAYTSPLPAPPYAPSAMEDDYKGTTSQRLTIVDFAKFAYAARSACDFVHGEGWLGPSHPKARWVGIRDQKWTNCTS